MPGARHLFLRLPPSLLVVAAGSIGVYVGIHFALTAFVEGDKPSAFAALAAGVAAICLLVVLADQGLRARKEAAG